jgi:hypothetical protein
LSSRRFGRLRFHPFFIGASGRPIKKVNKVSVAVVEFQSPSSSGHRGDQAFLFACHWDWTLVFESPLHRGIGATSAVRYT